MDTNAFRSMTENDNSYRKPGALREGNVPKVAFNDLSNRVKRVFRSGTPQKGTFNGKKLAIFSEEEEMQKPNDYYNKLEKSETNLIQKQGMQASQCSGRGGDIELGRGFVNKKNHFSTATNENYELMQEEVFADALDELKELSDFPEPENFYPTQPDDLNYYKSLPSPNHINPTSYDFEQDFDFAAELTRRYPYKDDENLGHRMSPVEETKMSMYMSDSDEGDDGNDSDGAYLSFSDI